MFHSAQMKGVVLYRCISNLKQVYNFVKWNTGPLPSWRAVLLLIPRWIHSSYLSFIHTLCVPPFMFYSIKLSFAIKLLSISMTLWTFSDSVTAKNSFTNHYICIFTNYSKSDKHIHFYSYLKFQGRLWSSCLYCIYYLKVGVDRFLLLLNGVENNGR